MTASLRPELLSSLVWFRDIRSPQRRVLRIHVTEKVYETLPEKRARGDCPENLPALRATTANSCRSSYWAHTPGNTSGTTVPGTFAKRAGRRKNDQADGQNLAGRRKHLRGKHATMVQKSKISRQTFQVCRAHRFSSVRSSVALSETAFHNDLSEFLSTSRNTRHTSPTFTGGNWKRSMTAGQCDMYDLHCETRVASINPIIITILSSSLPSLPFSPYARTHVHHDDQRQQRICCRQISRLTTCSWFGDAIFRLDRDMLASKALSLKMLSALEDAISKKFPPNSVTDFYTASPSKCLFSKRKTMQQKGLITITVLKLSGKMEVTSPQTEMELRLWAAIREDSLSKTVGRRNYRGEACVAAAVHARGEEVDSNKEAPQPVSL